MECAYWQRGECRSCTRITAPYDAQLATKQERVAALLPGIGASAWVPPVASEEAGFRTKVKFVVSGTSARPLLGILDADGRGVDLSACPIQHAAITAAVPGLLTLVRGLRLVPYDVRARRGELKYVIVTVGDADALMVRFVLRSRRHVADLRRAVPILRSLVARVAVVTANIHPVHEATVEGEEEIVLTPTRTLPMTVGDVTLHLGPRSFSQTNTRVAGELYRRVAAWASAPLPGGDAPASLWDLYCGVGGFALHAARAGVERVTGVEISEGAVRSAERAARECGAEERAAFLVGDATEWASSRTDVPDVVVVNPPRRGIGQRLASWLDACGVGRVVYSSCNPVSLASDLDSMPHLQPVAAQLVDMFPHTDHAEVAVLLERR